jgi:hypothetical protein
VRIRQTLCPHFTDHSPSLGQIPSRPPKQATGRVA